MFSRRVVYSVIIWCFVWLSPSLQAATPSPEQLVVWASEAVVATHTYTHSDFLARQKDIAKYFTVNAWITYSKALRDSNISEVVATNAYQVSAVPLEPPVIKSLDSQTWQAVVPVLVSYKNKDSQQQQTLEVTIQFTVAAAGQGVRGFQIAQTQVKAVTPKCQCAQEEAPELPR